MRIEQVMRHAVRARGDVLADAYARIDASSLLYDSDRDDLHQSTVVWEWIPYTDDIGRNSADVLNARAYALALLVQQHSQNHTALSITFSKSIKDVREQMRTSDGRRQTISSPAQPIAHRNSSVRSVATGLQFFQR